MELLKIFFMFKKYSYLTLLLCATFFISSCDSETATNYREDSSGPIGLVSVFADEDVYFDLQEGLKDTLILGKIFPGLYYPPEVMFGHRHFESEHFNRFKATRLVLDVKNGNPSINMEKNKFSRPQAYVEVTGNTPQEILNLLKENQDELLEIYRWADYQFILNGHKSKARQDTSPLDQLNVEMLIPRDYALVEQNPNFVWFRKDHFNVIQNRDERDMGIVSDSSQDILNILLFKIPYAKEDLDIQEAHFILDSITKLYTKGAQAPREIYIKTQSGNDSIQTLQSDHVQVETNPMLSDYYDFQLSSETDEHKVYDTRGWWSMTLSQLGGPFTAKFILDKKNKQLYAVDAIMFAPLNQGVSKKRDYINSMESLFTTFKIKE